MTSIHDLLQHADSLKTHITETLGENVPVLNGNHVDTPASSAVLFLISRPRLSRTPWLILNKRSQRVSQPGDLCFPGGGPSPRMDTALARCLSLPGLPFSRWRSRIGYRFPENSRMVSQLLATSLRESFEEMGLNPLGVQFLGPLPAQHLVLFDRVIYPMVGWIRAQTHFRLNGEVEKLIRISIEQLLNPRNYARFQIIYPPGLPVNIEQKEQILPCFIHQRGESRDILWGATYRMIMIFLSQVFDFIPPKTETRPEINNPLSAAYFQT